ncbi:endoglucanase [Stappia sp. BW2]|uniref:glycosyl hydrolase family 8 n=1 Tax=Stappia sp. BW2 TaxID=2592622 RepID=UPI0011DED7CE|nr:glycosyl hydrolase family 8 [Stappia sp. BW2]TYC69036.1 endoglucanase [Stappia sp. BW2]
MFRFFATLAWCLFLLLPVEARPLFPSQPQAERLASLDRFWADWKTTYLHEGCGGTYVDTAGDDKPTWGGSATGTLTVSEAHGYGMLALVKMASRDPEARKNFEGMVSFYRKHQAASGPGLMAWNQTRDCKDGPDGGDMSATDGDLDTALALLLADEKWGGYREAFDQAQQAILEREVTADGMMRLGDWAVDDDYSNASRSSDFMPASFALFAKAAGDLSPRWTSIRDRGYQVWGAISADHAANTGLVPDFLVGLPQDPQPAKAFYLEGAGDGQFSWNALRFPWRLSLDLLETGDTRAAAHLAMINRWIRGAAKEDPFQIATTYRLDGSIPDDESTGSAAFIAMFAAGAIAGSGDPEGDQAWLDALWSAMISIPIADEDYYGNTLKLLAMIELSGQWQEN